MYRNEGLPEGQSGQSVARSLGGMRGNMTGIRKVMAALVALMFAAVMTGAAQTTATNAVTLISDNVTNARDTMVPIAIGALVLFIGIGAGVKFWRRIFGR